MNLLLYWEINLKILRSLSIYNLCCNYAVIWQNIWTKIVNITFCQVNPTLFSLSTLSNQFIPFVIFASRKTVCCDFACLFLLEACVKGFYKEDLAPSKCVSCKENTTTLTEGATRALECFCREGYHRDDNNNGSCVCK